MPFKIMIDAFIDNFYLNHKGTLRITQRNTKKSDYEPLCTLVITFVYFVVKYFICSYGPNYDEVY